MGIKHVPLWFPRFNSMKYLVTLIESIFIFRFLYAHPLLSYLSDTVNYFQNDKTWCFTWVGIGGKNVSPETLCSLILMAMNCFLDLVMLSISLYYHLVAFGSLIDWSLILVKTVFIPAWCTPIFWWKTFFSSF